jgi:hypothetical protein
VALQRTKKASHTKDTNKAPKINQRNINQKKQGFRATIGKAMLAIKGVGAAVT